MWGYALPPGNLLPDFLNGVWMVYIEPDGYPCWHHHSHCIYHTHTYKIIVVSLCVHPSVMEGQWTQFDLEIQDAVPHKPIHEFQEFFVQYVPLFNE